MACHVQAGYRKGPHFFMNFFWEEGMDFVRLFKIRSHFCQQFIGRNSHIDGKTEAFPDGIFDFMGGFYRGFIQMCNAGKIQEAFINA